MTLQGLELRWRRCRLALAGVCITAEREKVGDHVTLIFPERNIRK